MNYLQPSHAPDANFVHRHPKLTLAIAILVAIALPPVGRRLFQQGTRIGYTPVVESILSDLGLPTIGSDHPRVEVAVFSDYQCPICRADDPVLEKLIQRRRDVRVRYVDWPIFGAASTLAAEYALEANRQGKYAQLHSVLMRAPPPFTAEALNRIARSAGVDVVRLNRDLARDRVSLGDRLAKNKLEAWSLGLQGTPAYLIGPYLAVGRLDEGGLARLIDRAARAGAS